MTGRAVKRSRLSAGETEEPAVRSQYSNVPALLIVIAAPLTAFAGVLRNGFVRWDDHFTFLNNTHIRRLDWDLVRWAWTTFFLGAYQPLAWMMYALEYQAWGLDPRGYHLVSLILHVAVAVALYVLTVALLERAFGRASSEFPARLRLMSGLAVALFGAHPLQTEVVAWATGQSYLACALFALLAVIAYLRAVAHESGGPRYGVWLVVSWMLFSASMLWHAVSLGLPLVLLLLNAFPLQRLGPGAGHPVHSSWRRVACELSPFVLMSALFALLGFLAKQLQGGVPATTWSDVPERIAQASYSVCYYPIKTVLPLGITTFYAKPARLSLADPLYLSCLLAVVGVTVTLVLVRRRWPALLGTWLSYVVILAPNSGIVPYGSVLVADRYSYLATMSGYVLLAGGLSRIRSRSRGARRLAGLLGVLGIGALVALSRQQSAAWHDSVNFWSHALAHGGDGDPMVQIGLADALTRAGRQAEALPHVEAAQRLRISRPSLQIGLGDVFLLQGRNDEALTVYREALRRAGDDDDPLYNDARSNIGIVLFRQGRYDEARAAFSDVLRRNPEHINARLNLGAALIKQGRYDEARAAFSDVLRREPEHINARVNLGYALAAKGQLDEAIAQYRAVLRRDPDVAEAHNNLGEALVRQGLLNEAAAEFRLALQINPAHAEARRSLEGLEASNAVPHRPNGD